jgi:ATP-dependent RNA helicase DDX18/HAS1
LVAFVIQPISLLSPFFFVFLVNLLIFWCTSQVVGFAKLSFEKNKEQNGTAVYISVHDVKSNVRNCFTKSFYPLFIKNVRKKNNDDAPTGYCCRLTAGLYCVIPSNDKFPILYSFLKMKRSKKIMVFFSSCSSVHAELLNFLQIEVSDIHGKQKQQKRTATFFNFCKAESGTPSDP